jgi:TonB family protein
MTATLDGTDAAGSGLRYGAAQMRALVFLLPALTLAACEPPSPPLPNGSVQFPEAFEAGTLEPARSPGARSARVPVSSTEPEALLAATPDAAAVMGVPDAAIAGSADGGAPGRARRRGPPTPFAPVDPMQWRNATVSYASSVTPGDQRPLGASVAAYAQYLNAMHNRIHPIFTDSFLPSLDARPKSDALNDPKLVVRLEIVLASDGQLLRMGVVRPSGQPEFDLGALASVERAAPFGTAPPAILSSDGNLYLHWEFKRDEVFACSTMNARPYRLDLSSSPTSL